MRNTREQNFHFISLSEPENNTNDDLNAYSFEEELGGYRRSNYSQDLNDFGSYEDDDL